MRPFLLSTYKCKYLKIKNSSYRSNKNVKHKVIQRKQAQHTGLRPNSRYFLYFHCIKFLREFERLQTLSDDDLKTEGAVSTFKKTEI